MTQTMMQQKKLNFVASQITDNLSVAREKGIRFVLGPDGQVYPDFKERLPGKAIWIEANYAAVDDAVTTGHLKQCFGVASVRNDLASVTAACIKKRAMELLGLCRKQGVVLTGFTEFKHYRSHSKTACMLIASDTADSRVSAYMASSEYPLFNHYDSVTLSRALGRGNIHYVVVVKHASVTMLLKYLRLDRDFSHEKNKGIKRVG